MRKFKRGDIVNVWSLQSFSYGGFLEGEPGIVRQDQGSSVLVIVTRNIKGELMLDSSYEVYSRQLDLVIEATDESKKNVEYFLELNNKIKEKSFEKTKYDLPWQYTKTFYLNDDFKLVLDKNKLEFPEDLI